MSSYKLLRDFISVVLLCFYIVKSSEAQLEVGFYQNSCWKAEFIVKQEVEKGFNNDNRVAAGLVRMQFHDCFVRGCDGSVLIDSTSSNTAEKDAPPNKPSLRAHAFQVIDRAKATLEVECKGVVSCADIVAFAARDSVELTRGLGYDVAAGRRDGTVSLASEALSNLPAPTFNLSQLTQSFANKGLSQEEMVTLSGSHTLGDAHCTSFTNRLYNYSTSNGQDPTLDSTYAALLKRQCPNNLKDTLRVVPMDTTPALADVEYYNGVLSNKGLLQSDQALLNSPKTKNIVSKYWKNLTRWESKFAAAMVKMGNIGVLTGNRGEIRTNCRRINKKVV